MTEVTWLPRTSAETRLVVYLQLWSEARTHPGQTHGSVFSSSPY